jgi:hypothetical protein
MRPVWVVASIVGLGAFAFAQPILDLIGRNPEFFVARRFPSLDIVALAVGLVLVPALLAIPVLALRAVGRGWAGLAHAVVMAALVGLLAAGVLNGLGLGELHPVLFVAVAVGLGMVGGWSLARFSPVRTIVRFLGAAPVVFVAVFLFATPVSGLLLASAAHLPESGSPDAPGPVVVVVFDEFPTVSLLRGDGSIDRERFPSLAALADDGVWYRNAVGVRQQTEEALPSILTGRGVDEGSIPIAADHPYNLFTLLDDGFDVAAVENVTELCPEYVCENASRPTEPLGERWSSIRRDLGVVYRHLVYPDALTTGLPPIDEGWTSFEREGGGDFDIIERFLDQVTDDRRREVGRFLDLLETPSDEPPFRFAHFLHPHHPWDLTADGRVHGAPRPPGRFEVGWGEDDFLVAQGRQQHLLQASYADSIVGSIVSRLVDEGMYEEALVVVVADHGISIEPGVEHQRVITEESTGTIAYVPLFVKYPAPLGEAPPPGTVDDVRAETTDIVPTVADTVGIRVPWRTDGVSLLDVSARSARTGSVMAGSKGEVEIPAGLEPLLAEAEVKERWFPGGDPYALTPPGWEAVLGTRVQGREVDGVDLGIDQTPLLESYVPGDDPVPAFLSGTIEVDGAATGEEIVAVTIDGIVGAVTRAFEAEGSSARWEAMVDPVVLDSGDASVEVWLVDGPAGDPGFRR